MQMQDNILVMFSSYFNGLITIFFKKCINDNIIKFMLDIIFLFIGIYTVFDCKENLN